MYRNAIYLLQKMNTGQWWQINLLLSEQWVAFFEVTLWTPVIHTVLEQLNFTTFVESVLFRLHL